jgi:hypothetical protein
LFGVGDSGQITHRRRLGVEHSKCGDLPLRYGLGQPVEIDVRGSLPWLVRGLSGDTMRPHNSGRPKWKRNEQGPRTAFPLLRGLSSVSTERARRDSNPQPSDP